MLMRLLFTPTLKTLVGKPYSRYIPFGRRDSSSAPSSLASLDSHVGDAA